LDETSYRQNQSNEIDWWSHWSRLKWRDGSCYTLTSKDFNEPLFNHAGFIEPLSGAEKLLTGLEGTFRRLRRNPSFILPAFKGFLTLSDQLRNRGYKDKDVLQVLRLKTRRMKESEDVEIKEVGERGMLEWIRVYLQAFYGGGFVRDSVDSATRSALKSGRANFLLARIKGLPVGSTALYSTDGVVGAYCVGVVPEFRRMGVATSLLAHASSRSVLQGRKLVLQTFASDGLLDFYRRLGFELAYNKLVLCKEIFPPEKEESFDPFPSPGNLRPPPTRRLGVEIPRDLPTDSYIFADVFKGFEKNEALRKLWGSKTPEVLKRVRVVLDPRPGYLHVDNQEGTIYISQPYLRSADERFIYLDLIHELVHYRQYQEGKELYDRRHSYLERPTELEAYEVAVKEARRIGMTDKEIAEYLRVEWVEEEEFKEFLRKLNVSDD
jgi:GNAT superfamily N-acetyltransferase